MSKAAKIIISVCSAVAIAIIGVMLYIFWPAIKGTVNENKYYTQEELQEQYDNGFKDGNESETELTAKCEYYKGLVDDYYTQVNTLNNEIGMLSKNNASYKEQIETLTSTKTELQNTIDGLRNTNNANIENISNLTNQVNDLQTRISQLETEKTNKDAEIETLNASIASLNTQKENLNAIISNLEATNADNLNTIISLNNQKNLLSSQIVDLQQQLSTNDSSIIQLNNKIHELEKSIQYYENYIFELENNNHFVGIFEFNGSVYKVCEADDNDKVTVEDPQSTELVIFNYWMVNNERVDLSTYVLTENTKFVANVTYKYSVKFIVDETEYNSQIVENGNRVSIPNSPVKDKYNFLGWSLDGVNVIDLAEYTVNSDVTFIAIFQNKYGLFNSDNGNLIYSWQELLDYDYLQFDDETKTLSAGGKSKRISGDLIIDEEVENLAASTFYGCSGLVKCVMPTGLQSIGNSVFNQCTTIESVTIPATVRSIGNNAFNCAQTVFGGTPTSKLKEVIYLGTLYDWMQIDFTASNYSNPIYFAKNLYLGDNLLSGTIIIPETVTEIKPYTFYGFNNEFIIPNTIKKISNYAFAYSGITNLGLPNSVEEYGTYTFAYSSIEDIVLPSNFTSVTNSMFYSCKNLKSFNFSNIQSIGNYAFNYCTALKELNLTKSILHLGTNPFRYCTSVEIVNYDIISLEDISSVNNAYFYHDFGAGEGFNLYIGRDCEHIPASFMSYLKNLKYINIPNNVKSIGDKAFYECRYVDLIYFNANIENSSYNYNTYPFYAATLSQVNELTLEIGKDVETIPSYFICSYDLSVIKFEEGTKLRTINYKAFYNTRSLNFIYIPRSVTNIYGINNDYRNSPFYSGNESLKIYCERNQNEITFDSKWNFKSSSTLFTTYYGYTYEQYLAEIGG